MFIYNTVSTRCFLLMQKLWSGLICSWVIEWPYCESQHVPKTKSFTGHVIFAGLLPKNPNLSLHEWKDVSLRSLKPLCVASAPTRRNFSKEEGWESSVIASWGLCQKLCPHLWVHSDLACFLRENTVESYGSVQRIRTRMGIVCKEDGFVIL